MSPRPRAVVLHGATADRPDEVDTLVQAEMVADILRRSGWIVRIVATGLDLSALDRLLTPRPDAVFNLVEALGGDGRLGHLVPGVLEHLGIPFTGASAATLFATTLKPMTKALLRGAGLPTPDWIAPDGTAWHSDAFDRMIVKAAAEDASLGIDSGSVVPAASAAAEVARRAARHGGDWFAEAYIDGREFNVGLLEDESGPRVLPIAEILFVDYPEDRPRIVDYEAKWIEDSFAYNNTPRQFDLPPTDAPLLAELGELARRAFTLFGLRGYGRVDFRVDAEGRPWILEINANPGLSPDAGFAAAATRAGLAMDDVVRQIVHIASRKEAQAAA